MTTLITWGHRHKKTFNIGNSHYTGVVLIRSVFWGYFYLLGGGLVLTEPRQQVYFAFYNQTRWGKERAEQTGASPFIGIVARSLKCCRWPPSAEQHWWRRETLYTQWMIMYTTVSPFMITECLSEEETSAAAARKPSTSLRKCSARGRAGINPVFCAVSIKVLR